MSKIKDYAAIGDGRCAALVSREGSLDWLCWPRPDSPSLFGRLLDERSGGSFSISPAAVAQIDRRYVPETNVLESRFRTASGVALLTDFMPAASEEQKGQMLWPEHELIRFVQCQRGEVELAVEYNPQPDFGRAVVALEDAGPLGLRIEWGARLFVLRCDTALVQVSPRCAKGQLKLRAGQSASFSLTSSADGPAVIPPLGDEIRQKLAWTTAWWQRWAAAARYDGPFRDQVVRSALVLKLLSFAPSGAILAAPTTSLPERLGGDRNWDYRFCWLRDAAFTARALFGLGYREEAEAFVSWTLHATRLTRPELRVVYDVYGERKLAERELVHWRGYADSRPVRIGNAAQGQFQLDIYGDVIEAVTHFVQAGGDLDRDTQTLLRQFGDFVCRHWHEPDNGIWEPRRPPEHYTHSRLLCWVALDRLIGLCEQGRLPGAPIDQLREARHRIRQDIEASAWNPRLAAYTQVLGGDALDATALLMAFYGFEEAAAGRMGQTFRRICQRLGCGPGLVYRNEQSLAKHEGAFAMCSFWIAEFLARGGGTREQAEDAMRHTLAYANDLGLFAEEIDAQTGDALGNYPQAFTHVGLINAALALADRRQRDVQPRHRVPVTLHQRRAAEVQR
jgi:GH15 family glucan-1,4-alpha-glucosidase